MTRAVQVVVFSVVFAVLDGPVATAQCLLANPSFEMPGTNGAAFAGWNQFGQIATVLSPAHGAVAAQLTGAAGNWNLSAVWQRRDAEAGQVWTAGGCVWSGRTLPLTGATRAIVNIEWRDAAGELIDFESHTVADASTPPDHVQAFQVTSGPAPSGTVATHLLCGLLQSPDDPLGAATIDAVAFDHDAPPASDLQWGDFPGERPLEFSGRTWRVKGPGLYGPGPNVFADDVASVWVDAEDHLHLTVQDLGDGVRSTEVTLEAPLGYGDYVFTTIGRLDEFHPNVVLGLFLWEYRRCYDPANGWWNPTNEIDIEFSRWGDPTADVAQFVAQPYDFPGNIERFAVSFAPGERTTHAMRWLPDRVDYRGWRGGPADEAPGTMIHEWTYDGPHLPRPTAPRLHLNLWYISAAPNTPQEAVFESFVFVPADDPHAAIPAARGVWIGVLVAGLVLGGGMILRRRAVTTTTVAHP